MDGNFAENSCWIYYGSFVRDMASMSRDEKSCFFQKLYLAMVKCSVIGDHRPACNSAGMIDRYILGIDHSMQNLYIEI